jgi:multidrug efflux pump subunit AcrA (membrane-fusion protein)
MGIGYIPPNPTPTPKATPTLMQLRAVEIIASVAEDIVISISTQGESTPARGAEITFIASGEILSVTARPGEDLEKGHSILRLEDTQVSARLEQARQEGHPIDTCGNENYRDRNLRGAFLRDNPLQRHSGDRQPQLPLQSQCVTARLAPPA